MAVVSQKKLRSDEDTLRQLTWGDETQQIQLQTEITVGLQERPEETLALLKRLLLLAGRERSGQPLRSRGGHFCLVALAAWLGDDAVLPPECDAVLNFNGDRSQVRALLKRIPPARRGAMFSAWIREGSWSAYLMPYLDLAPSAADDILADARTSGKLREVLSWEGFARLRGTLAELDGILARYDAIVAIEAPPPLPDPPRVGLFDFVDPQRVLPGDYAGLDEVGKSQYRQTAGSYIESGFVTDPRDFIRQLGHEGLHESDAELRRWKVLRAGKHVYDLWIVWVENGLFFDAGTDRRIAVDILQGSYQASDRRAESAELAKDLAASETRSLWALDEVKKKPAANKRPASKKRPATRSARSTQRR